MRVLFVSSWNVLLVDKDFPPDGIDLHHLRALFMVQCVHSNPTTELLDDLYDMDISAQLDFWASDDNVVGMYNHDTKRIITFLLWLRDKVLILVSLLRPFAHYSPIQRHPDREEDLFNRHLVAIDNWFHSQLDNYPHSYCVSQILAAGTLTGFMSQDIFSVLGPDPNSRSRRSDPLQIYTPQAEYQEFYGILCQFLTDPVRSGKWCVDGSRYAVLAIFFLLFLRHE